MKTQPRALYLLNFISMWECFSFYGMRALLVLYMIQELNFTDSKAFAIYATYTTLIEFGGLVGGMIADRFLGLNRSIALGGWTIVLGHTVLAMSESQFAFFFALGIIILGTCFFRTNIAALLGTFYEEQDPLRESGFTLYYIGINIGGFLASILCGIVGEMYGWHAGFGLAALGMLSGNIALFFGRRILYRPKKEERDEKKIGLTDTLKLIVSGKYGFRLLLFYLAFLVLFYACDEQLGSTLTLFSERYINRETIWGTIPAASLITLNPLTILVMGPLFYRLFQRFPMTEMTKITISFLFLGVAFCLLSLGCLLASDEGIVPLSYACFSIFLISVGEIFIGPTVLSVASKSVPQSLLGTSMGMVTVGFSFANFLSGIFNQLLFIQTDVVSYAKGFNIIGWSVLLLAIFLFTINQRQKVLS